jgi:hypothetical protein
MQQILDERFAMKFHIEKRDLPVYNLVVASQGLKLKPSAKDENSSSSMGGESIQRIAARSADWLSVSPALLGASFSTRPASPASTISTSGGRLMMSRIPVRPSSQRSRISSASSSNPQRRPLTWSSSTDSSALQRTELYCWTETTCPRYQRRS